MLTGFDVAGWIKLPFPAITLGAWEIGWLESLKSLRQSQHAFEIVGAALLILSGIYMLNAYFAFIPELAA
ncbi:hypothetical protein SFMTTN_2303 [Sulfuriferula multivorans]|uniref:Uncharacterized protein n=1 Tax=Sulfuriferula multivorans TaxID=1559896 RepID=A0A401JFS9_9PROT|nr:hypothetical protein [Sulfuriferula multivorans]GBL46489.1 hypothetical protein SFMTTN_2303 [Sulfuriferula multivorans]